MFSCREPLPRSSLYCVPWRGPLKTTLPAIVALSQTAMKKKQLWHARERGDASAIHFGGGAAGAESVEGAGGVPLAYLLVDDAQLVRKVVRHARAARLVARRTCIIVTTGQSVDARGSRDSEASKREGAARRRNAWEPRGVDTKESEKRRARG